MKTYEWILFDADETLFTFDAFTGLKRLFQTYQVNFDENDFIEYEKVNKPLWVQYQNGEITSETLQITRFLYWAKKLNVPAKTLNNQYQALMAEVCQPFDGMKDTLVELRKTTKLGIITNGFTQLQQLRLEKTGLTDFFEFIVVSEEIGFAKPDIRIFDHAYQLMNCPPKEKVLMVGDNPDSDILGGQRIGFDTCWLNWYQRPPLKFSLPVITVKNWFELREVLGIKLIKA